MIHIYHFMPGRKIRLFALNRTGRAPRRRFIISAMPTWPSPRSERLGTPKIPAIRFTRGTYFGASPFHLRYGLPGCSPPFDGSDQVSPAPGGSYFQASGSLVTLTAAGYNYNMDWTPCVGGTCTRWNDS